MAVHDWTRVSQGIVHHFHNAWTLKIADLLKAFESVPVFWRQEIGG